jgi:hypothetical protein
MHIHAASQPELDGESEHDAAAKFPQNRQWDSTIRGFTAAGLRTNAIKNVLQMVSR